MKVVMMMKPRHASSDHTISTSGTHVSSVIRNDSASGGVVVAVVPLPPSPCSGSGSGATVATSEKSTVRARLPGREKRMKTSPSVQDSKRSATRTF